MKTIENLSPGPKLKWFYYVWLFDHELTHGTSMTSAKTTTCWTPSHCHWMSRRAIRGLAVKQLLGPNSDLADFQKSWEKIWKNKTLRLSQLLSQQGNIWDWHLRLFCSLLWYVIGPIGLEAGAAKKSVSQIPNMKQPDSFILCTWFHLITWVLRKKKKHCGVAKLYILFKKTETYIESHNKYILGLSKTKNNLWPVTSQSCL